MHVQCNVQGISWLFCNKCPLTICSVQQISPLSCAHVLCAGQLSVCFVWLIKEHYRVWCRLEGLLAVEKRLLEAMQAFEERLASLRSDGSGAGTDPGPVPPVDPAPPDLQSLLHTLEEMEVKEREVLARWCGAAVGTDPPGQQRQFGALLLDTGGKLQQLSASHASDADAAGNRVGRPARGAPAGCVPSASLQGQPEVVPSIMLRSVLRGRRRFLQHQELLGEGFMVPGHGLLPPDAAGSLVGAVEVVADRILDDLLLQSVAGECVRQGLSSGLVSPKWVAPSGWLQVGQGLVPGLA